MPQNLTGRPLVSLNSEQSTGYLCQTIDRLMREDQYRIRSGFDQAAAFVNGIFCDLASIDVRFEFDPVSLDDCRCEKVATAEYNVLCNIKCLPYDNMVLQGNVSTGAFQVKLNDEYRDSYDKVCWEDVCCLSSSGERFLNTRKIMAALYQAITTVLNCEGQEHAVVVCRPKPTHLLLAVNLHLAGVHLFNLFPAIKVKRNSAKSLKHFDAKIRNVFETLQEHDTMEYLQIVAKPLPSYTIWGLTFNDLENRLMHLTKYICLRHCFFALSLLQQKHLSRNGLSTLSTYNLQMMVVKELVKTPNPEEWRLDRLPERLEKVLKSVQLYLNRKTNKNIFTQVNLFQNCRKRDIKLLSKEFEYIRKFYKDILLHST